MSATQIGFYFQQLFIILMMLQSVLSSGGRTGGATGGSPPPPSFNTFFIRPDGGGRWTAARVAAGFTGIDIGCDGKTDQSYAAAGGTGTNLHCAYNDVRFLWDDQTFGNYPNYAYAGGDDIILRGNAGGAPWRVGFTGNGSTTDPWCFGGNGPFGCFMPAILSGTALKHTRFLGENFASCSTSRVFLTIHGPKVVTTPDVTKTTKVWGGHGVGLVANLAGSQFVDTQCLDISSFDSACQLQGSPQSNPCNKNIGSLSDYSSDAIATSNTSGNLLLQDLYIHGMNSRGIHGQQGTGPVVANHLWISIIPQTGWDFDDGTASGTGDWSLGNSIIEASGCQQKNNVPNPGPITDAQLLANITFCYSQGSGAVIGDGIGTPPASGFNVAMDNDVFQWNTQDGEDFGHMDTGSFSFNLTNSLSQHNMGQTFKNGWAFSTVNWLNNISIADCNRFASGVALPGNPSANVNQFNVDPCRAGDDYSINFQINTQMLMANNTLVTYAPTTFDFKCVSNGANCAGAVWTFNNNVILAYSNPAVNQGIAPADFCGPGCNDGVALVGTANRKNNIYFNLRACHANVQTPAVLAGTSTGEQCIDPQFVGQPASLTSQQALDGFNYNPVNPGSPLINGGITYAGIPTKDYAGNNTTSPPTIGSLNP